MSKKGASFVSEPGLGEEERPSSESDLPHLEEADGAYSPLKAGYFSRPQEGQASTAEAADCKGSVFITSR